MDATIARQIMDLSNTILEALEEVCNCYRVGNNAVPMVLTSDVLKGFAEIETELVSHGLLNDSSTKFWQANRDLKEAFKQMVTNFEKTSYQDYLRTMENIVIPSYIEWQKTLKSMIVRFVSN